MCIRKGAKDSFDKHLIFGSIFNLFTNYINLPVLPCIQKFTTPYNWQHCMLSLYQTFLLYNYAVYLFTLRKFCIIVPLHIFHSLYSTLKDIVPVVYLLMFVDHVILMCPC